MKKLTKITIITTLTLVFFSGVFSVSAWGGGGDGGGSCFLAGTQITMKDGSKKVIEDVKVGDKVLGYDFINDKYLTNTVLELENPIRKEWFIIILDNNTILKTTDDHPIYIEKENGYKGWGSIDPQATFKNSGWGMEVSQLQSGDYLKTENKELTQVVSIFNISEEIQTYNFKHVTNNNSFFAEGVLVHNKGGDSGIGGGSGGDSGIGGPAGGDSGIGGAAGGDSGIGSTPNPDQTSGPLVVQNYTPVGNFESASCSSGTITLNGWAFDPDSISQSIGIHIYEGSNGLSGSCVANLPRVDVNNAYGVSGNHGYSCNVPNISDGTHSITVYAIDTAGGVNPVLPGSPRGVVCVPPPTPVANCVITATPTSIVSGGSSTLTWTTTNANSFNINGIGPVPVNGSRVVSPSVTTAYDAMVYGSGGNNVCSATVVVTQPYIPPYIPPTVTLAPTCVISISPSSIMNGGSATMSWSTTNASSMSINQGIGGVSISGGSRNISPSSN
ncbi:hypothetical protein KKH36_00005, partial [Patescibacteria group bacterium]|nr:hypothetical protein [Patescibacteria group bacterium]